MCDKNNPDCVNSSPDSNNLNLTRDKQLGELFKKLDKNNTGTVTISDLRDEFLSRGHSQPDHVAKLVMEKSDSDESGEISLEEFLNYAKKQEKKLTLIFSSLDVNSDGRLDKGEVVKALHDIGLDFKEKEVEKLMERMANKQGLRGASSDIKNQTQTLEISWEDWRDYLLLSPSVERLPDVLSFWRHATYIDVGEDVTVPDDFTPQEFQTGMWWRNLVAGGVAGGVSRTFTAPLDRVKVFLQVHSKTTKEYGSIGSCLSTMIKEGGIKSLWRGNGMNVIKIAPESALKFMAYEQIKRLLKTPNQELRIEERFIAGSLAGAVSQSIIYPLEVIKTRLALRKTGEYRSVLDMIQRMLKQEGPSVFYRGYVPNLIGILPYAGIDLAIYETLKKFYLSRSSNNTEPPIIVLLACGTTSSACGQLASYPLALIRTRLQANLGNNLSMNLIFKNIMKSEGFPGLYRGLAPNFLKVAPAVSISYVVYERCRIFLGVNMT